MGVVVFLMVGRWADTHAVLTPHQNPAIPTYPHFSEIVKKTPHTLKPPVIRVIHPSYSGQLFQGYYEVITELLRLLNVAVSVRTDTPYHNPPPPCHTPGEYVPT